MAFRSVNSSFSICRQLLFASKAHKPVSGTRFCSLSRADSRDSQPTDESLPEHVVYNSLVKLYGFQKRKARESYLKRQEAKKHQGPVLPYSLRYLDDYTPEPEPENMELKDSIPESKVSDFNLPYTSEVIRDGVHANAVVEREEVDFSDVAPNEFYSVLRNPKNINWMEDYEKYAEPEEDKSDSDEWSLDYGTPDPKVPISSVPCGGCGALLHCRDESVPGYLPSEIFINYNNKELRSITCQRCHFLKHYNIALSVSVDPQDYPKIISHLKGEMAMVLLLVDLTDFPCSIWPNILDLIGKKRPIFLVGNKVDLLWGGGYRWLDHVKNSLRKSLPHWANVKHVSVISAKTGYGVENLINSLHSIWGSRGDVYLIGCTNVGKSTLFNALLQSDYCKVKAVDLLQRATTAPWPGTTLNLLKFPILKPQGWRLFLRNQRISKQNALVSLEKQLKEEQKAVKNKAKCPPQLIGYIGRTFKKSAPELEIDTDDNFAVPNRKEMRSEPSEGSGLDPNDPDFKFGSWLYDTPGVMHKEQILDLLTNDEIMLTIPKSIIKPRTYSIRPGWSVFIGGLARLDYTSGTTTIKFTVFAAQTIPVTICDTPNADQVYDELVCTKYMAVPQGPRERLKLWPGLKPLPEFKLCGEDREKSCADVVLSSAGWISITPSAGQMCKFIAWTPDARGMHVRIPALLPYAVRLRGKKILKTPLYRNS